MLTIDDCNTLYEKYKDAGFWYQVDLDNVDSTIGAVTMYDFIKFTAVTRNNSTHLKMEVINDLWDGKFFIHAGNLYGGGLLVEDSGNYYINLARPHLVLELHLTPNPVSSFELVDVYYGCMIVSSTQIPVINGEYDDKLWIERMNFISYPDITIDGDVVEVKSGGGHQYIVLPSATDCVIGAVISGTNHPLYRVSFREFKTIPNLVIDILYKGTSQEVKLYNYDTEEHITEFQAHYQGRKLKDNIITLDYDVDDTVDIVVDILDPAYPQSRVKLKASTIYYVARTQAELETAITNGIKTVMVTNHQQPTTRAVNEYVLLTSMELTDLNLINSDIHLTDCTVNNVNIIGTTFKDKGDNKFTDCKFQETTITSTGNPSKYNDCIITECTVTATELRLTGAITNTTLSNSLIISDGIIEVIGNTFTGKYSKDYFPSFLYLTGDYLAKNNTFTLSDTWTEPAFNMCIIKSIDTFNPSLFIAENTFNLNIEYSTEEPNTFYYNIVDDDKIKAKRLS